MVGGESGPRARQASAMIYDLVVSIAIFDNKY